MNREHLQSLLDGFMTDTCNRYLNAVDDLGVIDREQRAKKEAKILKARNELLDKWLPFYTDQLIERFRKMSNVNDSSGIPSDPSRNDTAS